MCGTSEWRHTHTLEREKGRRVKAVNSLRKRSVKGKWALSSLIYVGVLAHRIPNDFTEGETKDWHTMVGINMRNRSTLGRCYLGNNLQPCHFSLPPPSPLPPGWCDDTDTPLYEISNICGAWIHHAQITNIPRLKHASILLNITLIRCKCQKLMKYKTVEWGMKLDT